MAKQRAIAREYERGAYITELARVYAVSRKTIYAALRREGIRPNR